MKDKKVKVLLSAYNGEKYIKTQIDSILNQTYPNIEIYVRDDGSKDNTLDVLKPYAQNHSIHLEAGENVGFIDSFFWLVANAGEADYYAYCDQDDEWLPEKIQMAIDKIEEEPEKETLPILYFSDYDFYNGSMEYQGRAPSKKNPPSFYNALVDCMPLGFNMVFNKNTHNLLVENLPKHSCGHDWWTYMVCAGLGKVIYDKRSTVKYRRHESNVSAGGMDFIKFQIWRLKKFFFRDYFKNVRLQMREYADIYMEQLSKENQEILKLFTPERYRFKCGIKKCFFKKRFREGIFDEAAVRFLCLIGKL